MYILAVETTGSRASVACIDEHGTVIEKTSEETLNHLQSLMFMTKQMLSENGIGLSDISCVAASAGPGSFTGIRIGVSSARAFAQAMKLPCIAVPTLGSFLYNDEGFRGIVCPILDARRNQVYGGAFFFDEQNELCEAVKAGAYALKEYLALLKDSLYSNGGLYPRDRYSLMFFGDGVVVYRGEIENWQNSSLNDDIRLEFAPESGRLQKAASVARLAQRLYREGRQVNYEELTPVYMRKAEAERKLEEGRLSTGDDYG